MLPLFRAVVKFCTTNRLFSIFIGLQNGNENVFHGFEKLGTWLWKSIGKVLKILLKEFVGNLSLSANWGLCTPPTISSCLAPRYRVPYKSKGDLKRSQLC